MVAVQVAIVVGAGIQVLSWGLGSARRDRDAAAARCPRRPTDPLRRSFLVRAGALGVAAVGAGLGRALAHRTAAGRRRPAPATPIPPAAEMAAPLPGRAPTSPRSTPGLTPIVVPNDAFYRIDTALLTPIGRRRDVEPADPRHGRPRGHA